VPKPLIYNIDRAVNTIVAEMRADGVGEEVIAECDEPIRRALGKLARA